MKLSRLEMANFLSIQKSNLDFDSNCIILVGKNESGKSNILRALAYLHPGQNPVASDIRENLPGERDTGEAYVRFVFDLSADEKETFANIFSSNFLSLDSNQPLLDFKESQSLAGTLSAFPPHQISLVDNQVLYVVNLKKLDKNISIWSRKGSVIKGWYEKLPNCPAEFEVDLAGIKTAVGKVQFVHESVGALPEIYFKPATFERIIKLMGNIASSEFIQALPNVISWNYDPSLLLPSAINLRDFAANPETCLPLKYMFQLSSSEEIGKLITDAESKGNHSLKNLLKSVASTTSDHLATVWTDYSNVKIELDLNGPNIEPIISEKNGFSILQRSEGFRRFICFLLQISVRVQSNQLQNNLLLIDEPEIGLHPSSANDLRDELIRISESNLVVYSTHSIFMVDSKNIDRHLIVQKENEITSLLTAEDNGFAEEEMVFRALGHSIFNSLNETNIIFEGWKDKKLFHTYLSGLDLPNDDPLLKIGLCHATGASSLKLMSPIFELTERRMLIISDGDEPAIREKENFVQKKMNGDWLTYQDVDGGITSLTGEDFLKSDYLIKKFNMHFKKQGLDQLDAISCPEFGKLKYLEKILKDAGIPKDTIKRELTFLKEKLFEKLKFGDIDPKYSILVEGIRAKVIV